LIQIIASFFVFFLKIFHKVV